MIPFFFNFCITRESAVYCLEINNDEERGIFEHLLKYCSCNSEIQGLEGFYLVREIEIQ
jgi:hypothetical protein